MELVNRILTPFLLALGLASPALAHEFWIEPQRYQVSPGEELVADFRNGQNFEGTKLAYFDRDSNLLQADIDGEVHDLQPRSGDRPAITLAAGGDGLLILAHETTPNRLTYEEWDKFLAFAEHKDFPNIAERHDARGLPRDTFRESYTRHVKALIGVGTGEGADHAFGMQTEFVALTNPYAAGFDGQMRVALSYKGAPRGDAQVEVFDRAPDGTVAVSYTRTDADGHVTIPTMPGHTYLYDAVVLRDPEQDDPEIAWETLWAALTFAVPAR